MSIIVAFSVAQVSLHVRSRLVFRYVCSPYAESAKFHTLVVQLFRARAAELVKV